jgi:hypothetical protein
VKERAKECLIKVFQYDFPDTAEFGGSILDPAIPINVSMEKYAILVLLLFHPY